MTASSPFSTTSTSIEARKQRWREFLQPDALPGFLFQVAYNEPDLDLPPAPPLWPDKAAERIERAWRAYEHHCTKAAWLHDDQIPYLNNLTGTEIFAEAFGCSVQRLAHTNPFARPRVFNAAEADALRVPDLGSSTLAVLFEIADALYARAGQQAVMRLVDIQSPMDIAALIWEKTDFFAAMVEAPDAVRALAAKVEELLTAFLDEWFRRYGTEYVAHYPDYFMSGGLTLSEDEVGAVSEGMFDTFFYDELAGLSERYGGIGIHCCADARHQWGGFARVPGLRLLNLCAPPTRDAATYVRDAYTYFDRRIAQMHFGWTPEGPPETWPERFPVDRRVVFIVPAETRDQALAACEALNALRARRVRSVPA